MAIKFYNPGTKIDDMLRYDHPTNDPKYQNNISYFRLLADPQSFFDVPTVIDLKTDGGGELNVPVRFADRIKEDYKAYGIVKIDQKYKEDEGNEGDNVACNEKDAKKKGDQRWTDYLMEKAREHVLNVERVRAAGGVPMRATGVFAHALKVVHMADPADPAGNSAAQTSADEKIARLEKMVEALSKGKQ